MNTTQQEIQEVAQIHFSVDRTFKKCLILLCVFMSRFDAKCYVYFTSLSACCCLTFHFQTFELKINKAKRQTNKSLAVCMDSNDNQPCSFQTEDLNVEQCYFNVMQV